VEAVHIKIFQGSHPSYGLRGYGGRPVAEHHSSGVTGNAGTASAPSACGRSNAMHTTGTD
jgi:hypothetical protein